MGVIKSMRRRRSIVDELEDRGFVERVRNPEDRRSFLVHLPRAGVETQRKAAAELAGQAETLLKPLTAGERGQLVDFLTRIADHWEDLNAAKR
jgi:DNA-binding MarR family transcriptional regulator